jgi:hypothetical protein
MKVDQNLSDRISDLNKLAMVYETGVSLFSGKDYLTEFYDFYEIINRKEKLLPSPCGFEETLKDVSGDDCWKIIADQTKSLFGSPRRVMVFEDVRNLQDELGGPDGLSAFYSVFDLMFCEYEHYTLCFISGSNN